MPDRFRRRRVATSGRSADGSGKPHVDQDSDPLPEQVYLDAARHFLDVQISTYDVLDARAVQTFSIGSVVLPVTFALLNLGSAEVNISSVALGALCAALVMYLALLFCVIKASTIIRALEYRPSIQTLRSHSDQYSGKALLLWVANEYEESIQDNAGVLVRKSRWVGFASIALYVEGVLLSSAAILTLLL